MQLLRLSEMSVSPDDRVFRHSPVRALLLSGAVLGVSVACLIFATRVEALRKRSNPELSPGQVLPRISAAVACPGLPGYRGRNDGSPIQYNAGQEGRERDQRPYDDFDADESVVTDRRHWND